jgi:Helicase HerA, central domain
MLLGKCSEHTAISDRYGANVWLDYLRPHVLFIAGKRGSGKSYDLGVIAEGLGRPQGANFVTPGPTTACLLVDTQNQFWTLGFEPKEDLEEDREQLAAIRSWALESGAPLQPGLFLPPGGQTYLGTESQFQVNPAEVTADDWCALLETDRFSPQGHLLQRSHRKVTRDGWVMTHPDGTQTEVLAEPNYQLADLMACVSSDVDNQADFQQSTIDAASWRLESLHDSGLFGVAGDLTSELLAPGSLAVFMLRDLDDDLKSLVVSVLLRKVFSIMGPRHVRARVSRRRGEPAESTGEIADLVWVLIDEAHLVCPADRATSAKPVIVDFVKRGRDAGLSLVLATQQPAAVDSAVISQADISLVHRLATDADINAAVARLPATLPSQVKIGNRTFTDARSLVRYLDAGESLAADSEASRAFLMLTRPRIAAHGGNNPLLTTNDGS